MLSKMAQPNNCGGAGGGGASSAPSGPGRRMPLSLSTGGTVSRLQQSSGSNGRSNSPQNGNQKSNAPSSFGAVKKPQNQQRSSSTSSSTSSISKEEEKKSQNGVSKSSNGKEKAPQNGNKDQKEPKPKDKVEKKERETEAEKKDKEVTDKKESNQEEAKKEVAAPELTKPAEANVIVIPDDDEMVTEKAPEPSTPTKERKSTRKASSQQKSPVSKQASVSPAQKKQAEIVPVPTPAVEPAPSAAEEDVEMEALAVDASPIRGLRSNMDVQPAATSTPGRSLFGFRSSSKQNTEVELAAQTSSSPASTPARTFAQISGRRSIRPVGTLTPSKMGSYRCVNSDLDTSSCTNASMNATVGSEIPNSSSFSFSFFGRGRKRERTPPPLSGSQSANDLAQDVDMSPPKRARFEFFSMSLASPFSLLRSRFSKTTISTPPRLRLEQTPPGDDGGEVQNVSGIVIEEEDKKQLNTSSVSVPGDEEQQASKDLTVGQEAGLETPKKSGSPMKEIPAEKDIVEGKEADEKTADEDENVPPLVEAGEVENNRSRCSIM
ncbi:hypothetical protein KR009_002242 [Drosophila setifemur]|nr:hypothetical protein KR009_002242 [Drosophila setifemur]